MIGPPEDVDFRIFGEAKVLGHDCFEIQLEWPERPPIPHTTHTALTQERRLLYYRRDTGTLIRVVNNSIGRPAPMESDYLEQPLQDFMGDDRIALGVVPFMFPDWSKARFVSDTTSSTSFRKTLTPEGRLETPQRGKKGEARYVQELSQQNGPAGRRLVCRFAREFRKEGESDWWAKDEVFEVWAPDGLWWEEARRYRFEELDGMAVLVPNEGVRENGRDYSKADPQRKEKAERDWPYEPKPGTKRPPDAQGK